MFLSVSNVSKSFGHNLVLDDISLNLDEPQIHGLLGPSGAGKTTLVKIIAGLEEADSGEVLVFEKPMPDLKQMEKIGYMAQSDALYSELTARENIKFFASLYGMKKAELKKRVEEVMAQVGLQDDLDKFTGAYSGGMKRRLSLAIALIHRPKLLILDEPTVGIDPLLRQSIWHEFLKLRDQGTCILVTTHVMDEAAKCDTLSMMRIGKIIAAGTPEQLKQDTGSETLEDAFLTYGGAGRAD
ncbi:MAG TPA: ABC transporter ATP-binding protein [Bacillales bacterium]|nr:ABC transporter ATP-binding protein [Bacillales bacterium]